MKKQLFLGLAALAAVTFTSCQKDLVVNQMPQEQPIEFGTYLGRDAQTKASVFETDDMKSAGFGVFAYYTGTEDYNATAAPNFMNNTQVTYSSDAWKYSPVKYWPNNDGDKVSFFAYAPYKADAVIKTGAKIDFTVANTVTDQTDLTWNSSVKLNQTKPAVAGTVKFVFGHALSRIGFTLQAAVDQKDAGGTLAEGTTITLNKVVIGSATNGFYKSGSLDLTQSTATWTNTDGNQFFTLLPANFIEKSNIITSTSNTKVNLIDANSNNYIMIIPQKVNNFDVYVEYTVETKNGTTVESTITNKITKQTSIDFIAGQAYTINLVLGMTSVKVEAEVSTWDGADPVQVDLPKNN